MIRIDHIVFAARDLAEGRSWMAARLGLPAQGGGAHPGMGTHNALWRLGAAYLEVIAPDPDAPPPGRARLFGLDLPETAERLAAGPALLAWVAATDDLDAARAAATEDFGPALPLSRGDLAWRLTVTADGVPPLGGALPALIEWPPGAHPVERMEDRDLRLARLACGTREAARARAALEALGGAGLIDLAPGGDRAALSCVIETPSGRVRFGAGDDP